MKNALAITILMLVIWGCDSYDLGHEPFDVVEVNVSAPTWANGIGKLIKDKCANCHMATRSDFVPGNTPATFDNIGDESFFTSSANAGKIAQIKQRVFLSAAGAAMPPNFATPLGDSEKRALSQFLDDRLATFQVNTCQTATNLLYTDVASVVARNCAMSGCHVAGGIRQPLTTLEQVKTLRDTSLRYLQSDVMPPGGNFRQTSDGERLIEWLCAGADVK